jgi:hypothetical protein
VVVGLLLRNDGTMKCKALTNVTICIESITQSQITLEIFVTNKQKSALLPHFNNAILGARFPPLGGETSNKLVSEMAGAGRRRRPANGLRN